MAPFVSGRTPPGAVSEDSLKNYDDYTSFRSLSYKNFIKGKMTGRVDILWRIVEIIAKKLKLKDPKKQFYFLFILSNLPKTMFFRSCDFILNFLHFSQKCVRVYRAFFVARTFLVELHSPTTLFLILNRRVVLGVELSVHWTKGSCLRELLVSGTVLRIILYMMFSISRFSWWLDKIFAKLVDK